MSNENAGAISFGMDYHLKGKRALVTGSGKGIGRATAELLHEEGATVILHARTPGSLAAVAERLPGSESVTGDLGSSAGTTAVLDQLAALGPVDILVNNAGIFEAKPFFEIPDEDWLRFFEVNVMSGVRLARALMPGMLSRGWGRIVFVSSESGVNIPIEMVHYGMTKTAQLAVSRGLAELTKGSAVTVNAVLPGPTFSDGVEDLVESLARTKGTGRAEVEAGFFASARPTSLLQRFATPREVAQLIAYVASPIAAATNGAALRVDGGVVKTAF